MPDDPKKPSPLLRQHRGIVESSKGMSPAIFLGTQMALAMGIFAWLGHQADLRYDSEPWGVLAGISLGLAYGGYEVWKLVRGERTNDESSTSNSERRSQGEDET